MVNVSLFYVFVEVVVGVVCVCVGGGGGGGTTLAVCVCDSFFLLLSLFVTMYIFLHLTVMPSSTFGKGWVGMSACPLVVLACESLHVCTVCIWRCEHARFCVEVFYALYINFHSFIHSHSAALKIIVRVTWGGGGGGERGLLSHMFCY